MVNHMLDRVAHKLENRINPEDVVVIAPDIDFLEQIKLNLLSNSGLNILYDAPFKTFGDLVRDLIPDIKIVSVSYLRLLMKNTMCDTASGLPVEGRMPGFRRKAHKLFEEFDKVSPINRDKLLDLLMSDYPDGAGESALIRRIVKSYRDFKNQLIEKGIDTQDSAIYKACEKIQPGSNPNTIFIIGFNSFTPPQLAFINALTDVVDEIIISLPVIPDSDDDSILGTKQKLINSGFENFVLQSNQTNIQLGLKLVDSNRDEAEFIARKSAEFIETGIDPSDILIVHPRPGNILSLYESTFASLEIPMKSRLPIPLKEISPVREILAILGLLDGDLDSAMSLLSSRFAQKLGLVVKQLDNKLLDSLIDGKNAIKPDNVDSSIWDSLNYLSNKARCVSDFKDLKILIKDIMHHCLRLPDEIPHDYSGLTSTSLRTFHSLLDEIEKLSDENEITGSADSQYGFLLIELMDQVRSSIVRPRDRRRQAVELTGFDNIQMKNARVVFLAGMNDANFPTRSSIDPLLGEIARHELHDMRYPFETQQEIVLRENILLRIACNIANDSLFITVPSRDNRGEANEISPSLIGIYPTGWEIVKKDEIGLFTRDDLITETGLCFNDDSTIEMGRNLQNALDEFYPRATRVLNSNVTMDSSLKSDIAQSIRSNLHSFSASALNSYTRCPFLYFAQRILKLQSAQTSLEKILTPLVRGSVIHKLLSIRISEENKSADIVEILKEEGIEIDELHFIEEAILKDYIAFIEIFIQSELERISKEKREILHAEFQFGMGDSPNLTINIDGKDRSFSGAIDRIDKLPDGTCSILDYKTSSQDKKKIFEEAAKFQLPLYVIALENFNMAPSIAEIIAIGRKKSSCISTKDMDSETGDGIEELLKTGMENIKRVVNAIESAEFPIDPPETDFCGWDKCGFYHVCRIKY